MPFPTTRSCRRPLVFSLLVLLAATGVFASPLPEGFRLEPVVGGLDAPTALAATPDGRLLVAEKAGTLRVIEQGVLGPNPLCTFSVDATGDGGLLGVAVHPDERRPLLVYVYLTKASGTNAVERYAIEGARCRFDGTIVGDLGAAPTGLRVGGGLAFGPDGKLYVATGDMENPSSARDGATLPGSVLRVNDDGSIPADNPEAGSLVFAKGVRFGRGLDVAAAGDVYIADAGAAADSSHDELNPVPAGGDLGWDAATGDSGGVYDDPLVSWSSPIGVRGLAVYAATAFPDLDADGTDSDEDAYGPDHYPGLRAVDDNAGTGVCVGSERNGEPCTSVADCPPRPDYGFGIFTESTRCSFNDDPAEYCPSGVPYGDDACGATGGAGIDEPDESYRGALFLAAEGGERIVRATLDPSDPSALSSSEDFLRSDALPDCPLGWVDVLSGADGLLYALADNGGADGAGELLRIVHDDTAGPREVSQPGSYFPLVVARGAGQNEVVLRFEDLRSDAFQPRDDGADPLAPEREYTVWQGTLGSWYDHAPVSGLDATAGTAVNDALREVSFDAGPGGAYFLVSARGANLEGSLGRASDGAERPGYALVDLCETIGYHEAPNYDLFKCGQNFELQDEHGRPLSIEGMRGQVMMLDFSAWWCGPCQSEADVLENLNSDYEERGVRVVTVLFDEESNGPNWVGRPAPAECREWSDRAEPNPDHTFPCLVDALTPDGQRQAWPLYNKFNAVPTNVVIDRGLRVAYTTGGYPEETIRQKLDALVGTSASCLD